MTGPFRNLTKWVAVHIFLLHMLQKVWPQTAQNIFASIYTFSVPPSCPYKARGPRRNSYNMVWCFVLSCAYSHIAEDTPREVLKIKFEFKVILSICVVFLFPRPPSCDITPLQNDRFPSKGMFVLNTAFVGRQLDFLSLPPCRKRSGKIRWPDMLGHRIFPCWCSSEFFRLFLKIWNCQIFSEFFRFVFWKSEIFRFFLIFSFFFWKSDFFWISEIFSENRKFSDFFWIFQIFSAKILI